MSGTRRDFLAGVASAVAVAFAPPLILPTRSPDAPRAWWQFWRAHPRAPLVIEVLDCGEQRIWQATKWDADGNETDGVEYVARVHRLKAITPCCHEMLEAHAMTDVALLALVGDKRAFIAKEMEPHRESMEQFYASGACCKWRSSAEFRMAS